MASTNGVTPSAAPQAKEPVKPAVIEVKEEVDDEVKQVPVKQEFPVGDGGLIEVKDEDDGKKEGFIEAKREGGLIEVKDEAGNLIGVKKEDEDKKDKKDKKEKKEKKEGKEKKEKKEGEKKEKKEKKEGKEKKEKKEKKEGDVKEEVPGLQEVKKEDWSGHVGQKRSPSKEKEPVVEQKKRKTKWGEAVARPMSMGAIPRGNAPLPQLNLDLGHDTTPRFSADEMRVRTVVIENLTHNVTGSELIEFFNGAVLAVTGNQLQQAQNRMMAPVYQCSVRDAEGSDDGPKKMRIAELRFRTPEGAHVGIKLNGIEYKGTKLFLHRPEGYKMPETGDPSKLINLHEMTMPKLLGRDTSQQEAPAQKLSIFNLPTSMPEAVVRDLLSQFGALRMLNLIKDLSTGRIKGYGFFEYDQDEDVEIAVQALNGFVCGSNVIRVQKLGSQASAETTDTPGAGKPVAATAMANSMTQKIVANPVLAMQVKQGREVGCRPTQVVQLLNAVYQEDLMDDQDYEEIVKEIHDEACKHGTVSKVHIPKPSKDGTYVPGVGKVFIHFQDITASRRFQQDSNGRKFENRVCCAAFYPVDLFLGGQYKLSA